MKDLDTYGKIAFILILIAGINAGLLGLFGFSLINSIFGNGLFGRLIFLIIGVGAGYLIYYLYIKKPPIPPTM